MIDNETIHTMSDEELAAFEQRIHDAREARAAQPVSEEPQVENLEQGEPIQIGATDEEGRSVLGAILSFALGEEFAELVRENREFGVQSVDDTVELQDALIRVHELEQELAKTEEHVQTLQVVLGSVFLDVAAAHGALASGNDANEYIDAAATSILSARSGKFHFHIHE